MFWNFNLKLILKFCQEILGSEPNSSRSKGRQETVKIDDLLVRRRQSKKIKKNEKQQTFAQ